MMNNAQKGAVSVFSLVVDEQPKKEIITGLRAIACYFGVSTKTIERNARKKLYGKSLQKINGVYHFCPDEFWK